jgi:hypothetical protein
MLRLKTTEQRRLLERERDELGKRLERWGIATDAELGGRSRAAPRAQDQARRSSAGAGQQQPYDDTEFF